MTLGIYKWFNRDSSKPGYGEVIEIDIDALPKTSLPPNVPVSNLWIHPDTGELHRIESANFRFGTGTDGLVKHQLYYSTNFTETDFPEDI